MVFIKITSYNIIMRSICVEEKQKVVKCSRGGLSKENIDFLRACVVEGPKISIVNIPNKLDKLKSQLGVFYERLLEFMAFQ